MGWQLVGASGVGPSIRSCKSVTWPLDKGQVAHSHLGRQPVQPLFRIASPNATFPKDYHTPSLSQQSVDISPVASDVCLKLGQPEIRSGRRRCRIFAAGMSVPVTTMNQHANAEPWHHNIRRTWQAPVVQYIPEPCFVKQASDRHFRPGILATNTRHPPGAGCSVNNVSQGRSQVEWPSLTK